VVFTHFDMHGPADVSIQMMGEAPKDIRIRPLSKHIAAQLDGNVVQVQLSKPGNDVVEFDLSAGTHGLVFAYREDGTMLDQVALRRR
jgi:hypothetical protein